MVNFTSLVVKNMTEAIRADNYLQTYLDEITKNYSKHYVQTIIERILNCKPVYALNEYSRELPALAMEKLEKAQVLP